MVTLINRIEFHLPENILSNDQLVKEFPDWDKLIFEKKVGIFNRHIAGEDETALDLALKASEKVLENIDKRIIDFVILCTQSPDYFLPTSACILQDKLGLRTDIGAFDFNLGCSGYIYGLSICKGLLSAKIASNILFVVSETYSKHIHPKDRSNRSIFGDGAAATVIQKGDEKLIGEFVLGTNGKGYDKLIVKNGGFRSRSELTHSEFTYGTNNITSNDHLYMDGPEIFNFTIDTIPELVEQTLKKNNLIFDDIDYFVFHQANKYMLEFLRKKINIPKEKFCINFENSGNTVSATIPIAIKELQSQGKVKYGDKIMIVGFGVGLSYGAVILDL
jgi:3-oxoacyl-[acyl-carrier-protein] synthase-3